MTIRVSDPHTGLYPLSFEPILKELIWGGHALEPFKGQEQTDRKIGESWEISQIPGAVSTVATGTLTGMSLNELMEQYQERLLGKHVWECYGMRFPLLIKYIDAARDLSIQVHPTDEVAEERHGSFGKTEMWYVVDASPGASIKVGFQEEISKEDFIQRSADGSICDALKTYEVQKGEVYFLPAGRIHAICSGCFVAEIQQSSDITYRIYDYDRRGDDGKKRELHTEQAVDVVDYTVYKDYRSPYHLDSKKADQQEVVRSPYFVSSVLSPQSGLTLSLEDRDSFTVMMVVAGELSLTTEGETYQYTKGATILIPAEIQGVSLSGSRETRVLEAYVP